MTKKEICENNKTFGYYSSLGGLEFKKIEYGIDDFIYCVSGAWSGKPKAHKLKIYSDNKGSFIRLHGYKVNFDDCIRV